PSPIRPSSLLLLHRGLPPFTPNHSREAYKPQKEPTKCAWRRAGKIPHHEFHARKDRTDLATYTKAATGTTSGCGPLPAAPEDHRCRGSASASRHGTVFCDRRSQPARPLSRLAAAHVAERAAVAPRPRP